MKTALVCGGHGFIGHHLARELKSMGYWVRTVDIKEFEYGDLNVDDQVIGDLREPDLCSRIVWTKENKPFDEVYQLAADMGGAGFVFTGDNDADIMHNSAMINLNMADACKFSKVGRMFYSSSACMYPSRLQDKETGCSLSEDMAYPAGPDSEYGWEKLFSEHLYLSYSRNYGLNVRIARFHNIFGPEGSWKGGREKAPAAICRKIAETPDGGSIDIWGDGNQTRTFLYVEECVEGVLRLMSSDFTGPVNIGSDELVSINKMVDMVKEISGKKNINVNHIDGPVGVRGRCSDNTLIEKKLGWSPQYSFYRGLRKTYPWIENMVMGKE